jgi:hypothetical protein
LGYCKRGRGRSLSRRSDRPSERALLKGPGGEPNALLDSARERQDRRTDSPNALSATWTGCRQTSSAGRPTCWETGRRAEWRAPWSLALCDSRTRPARCRRA